MAEIDDHIATYLQAIEIEGKSVKTIASYANTLADFRTIGRRLGFPERPEEYRVPHVYAFLSELRTRGASAAYQHRRHREVKACFSWLRRMEVIEQNVFARVPLVKQPIVIKEPFNVKEIMTILTKEDAATYVGCRNRAIVLFLLDTGWINIRRLARPLEARRPASAPTSSLSSSMKWAQSGAWRNFICG